MNSGILQSLLFIVLISLTAHLSGCDIVGGGTTKFGGGTRLLLEADVSDSRKPAIETIRQTAEVIKSRLNLYGVRRNSVQIAGDSRIEVLIPKVKDVERLKRILIRKGKLEMRFVTNAGVAKIDNLVVNQRRHPDSKELETLESEAVLDGSMIQYAEFRINSNDEPYMMIGFTDAGSKRFAEVTLRGVGRKLAILMDGKILVAPVIREVIYQGRSDAESPLFRVGDKGHHYCPEFRPLSHRGADNGSYSHPRGEMR